MSVGFHKQAMHTNEFFQLDKNHYLLTILFVMFMEQTHGTW